MPRGGKREGAGAKPMPPEQRRVMLSIRIAPKVRAYLDVCKHGPTATVERALLRSPDFKLWEKGGGK